jgi:hypothetical protein
MMNQVMQRPLFRQQGSPMGGEQAFMQYLQTALSPEQLQALMQDPNRDQIIGQLYQKFMSEQQAPSSPMVMRQTGSPNTGEISVPSFLQFNILDKLGVIDNSSLNREVPDKSYKINLDDAMTNPQLLNTVFEMITGSTDFDLDAFMNMGSDQQDDYLKTIKGRIIFGKAEGGEMNSDAVGIADGLDQEEPMTADRDPSQEGIAKVSPDQYVELMNEIRGDEVPMDGRVQELAGVVGEKDATDTPLSVLALVQPVFELQEQKGIGATQQAQDMMPPMASDQLANPQNMGVVRARTGIYMNQTNKGSGIDSLDKGVYEGQIVGPMPTGAFGMYGTPTIEGAFSTGLIAGQGQPNQANVDQANISSMLISDLMEKYSPPEITGESLQKEIDLLKSIQGDTKGEAKKALAFLGIQKGLELAEGEKSIEQLLRETAGDIFKITNAVTQADKAVALQAYKSLADRRSSMTAKQFELEKMQLENSLKFAFEKAKGMEDPIFLKEPRSGMVTVLDKKKDADKISVLLGKNFEVVSTSKGQEINISIPESGSGMKDGGIVYRSNGSNSSGETSVQPFSYEEALKGIQEGTMGYSEEDFQLPGGLVLITDKSLRAKYNNRINQGVKLEGYLDQAIKLIEENPKLAGLVGDAIQGTQNVVLPINQLLAVIGQESPFPEKVNEFVSDPDIQELASLEYRIADNLATFEKDVASTRVPAIDKVREYMKRLKISGLSSDVQAVNALKSFRNDLVSTLNQMRLVTGNNPIGGSSDLDSVITKYSLSPDDDLIKMAIEAINTQPAYKDTIIKSLIDKLESRSED